MCVGVQTAGFASQSVRANLCFVLQPGAAVMAGDDEPMIIDFSLKNFRSVKQAQVFSLLALQTGPHLSQHVAYPAGEHIGVLRSAGIYGTNAAGKSNILLGFDALRFVACGSGALKEGQPIPCYDPTSWRWPTARRRSALKLNLYAATVCVTCMRLPSTAVRFWKKCWIFIRGGKKPICSDAGRMTTGSASALAAAIKVTSSASPCKSARIFAWHACARVK